MTTTNYQQQAIDFLNATSTGFTAKFKGSLHPEWDKEYLHDAFTCTLVNKLHRYRFTFYQSRNESTGAGTKPPTAYDVLAGVTKYEIGTFDNFCSEFGYDTDSRSAYKTYKAVLKEWKNIERLFNPDQLELLQEIN